MKLIGDHPEVPAVHCRRSASEPPAAQTKPMGVTRMALLTLTAIGLLAAACSSTGTASGSGSSGSKGLPAPAPVHATINVAAVGSIDGTSFFSALEQGYFKKWGLTAKIQVYPTGVEVMNQIVSGAAQFGDVGADPVLGAISKGLPLKVIADNHGSAVNSYYAENQAIVAGPNSGLSAGDIAGLKGKKIGIALGTDAVGYLQTLLARVHLTPSDVTMINVTPADGITALARGAVDAIATFEPWPSVALQQVPGSTLVVEDQSKTWYDPGVIVSSTSYLQSNPRVAEAFLAAVAESESWVRAHLTQAATVATQWITGLQPTVADRAIQHVTFDMRMSKLVINGLQDTMIPFLQSSGQLAGPLSASTAVDPKYMLAVQNGEPQYFKSLPPIPSGAVLSG
jgi:ABC-type nitrate/sulfonate/bicarbonate transport system substrate-binding protein